MPHTIAVYGECGSCSVRGENQQQRQRLRLLLILMLLLLIFTPNATVDHTTEDDGFQLLCFNGEVAGCLGSCVPSAVCVRACRPSMAVFWLAAMSLSKERRNIVREEPFR